MTLFARDIMVKKFDTIQAEAPVTKAIEMILNGRIRETGHKTISLLVLDEFSQLAGVVSMFDVLYHLRPSFLNYGISGEYLPWKGQLANLINEIAHKKVGQIMSTNIIGASQDEHLMVILDRMVKYKYRRLPVLENSKPIGIVYISDIYHHLFSKAACLSGAHP